MILTNQQIIDFIVAKIDSLRVEESLSIYELSLRANLSINTLNDLFKKRSVPSIRTLNRLCDSLGIPLWELFVFDNVDFPLNNNEKELIAKYRKMSDASKRIMFALFDHMK